MTLWEAITAAKLGNKVKRTSTGHVFMWKDFEMRYVNDESQVASVNQMNLDADWQIVPEPPKRYTFIEAVALMKQGKKMKISREKMTIENGEFVVDGEPCVIDLKQVESQWEEVQ